MYDTHRLNEHKLRCYYQDWGSALLECIERQFPQVSCLMQTDWCYMKYTVLILDASTNDIVYKRVYDAYDYDDPSVMDDIISGISKYYNPDDSDLEHENCEKHAHYCESCGAPLQKGSAVCVYCGTEIY